MVTKIKRMAHNLSIFVLNLVITIVISFQNVSKSEINKDLFTRCKSFFGLIEQESSSLLFCAPVRRPVLSNHISFFQFFHAKSSFLIGTSEFIINVYTDLSPPSCLLVSKNSGLSMHLSYQIYFSLFSRAKSGFLI